MTRQRQKSNFPVKPDKLTVAQPLEKKFFRSTNTLIAIINKRVFLNAFNYTDIRKRNFFYVAITVVNTEIFMFITDCSNNKKKSKILNLAP